MRHVEREAAAKCASCGGFYCRECVTEHDHQLVCTSCLQRQVKQDDAKPQLRWLTWIRGAVGFVGAVCLVWILFLIIGLVLVKIPPDFHDGTVWSKRTPEP